MVANSKASLHELVEQILSDAGPAHYQRTDMRLNRPIDKNQIADLLINKHRRISAVRKLLKSYQLMV